MLNNDGYPGGPGEKSVLVTGELEPWQDRGLAPQDRVADLVGRMTLTEKVAQLYSIWAGVPEDGDDVAPFQHELIRPDLDWAELIKLGLGQLTRPFGSAPVDPAVGAMALARLQGEIVSAGRFRIPAVVHEECLTGFMTWTATVYPTPLAWGAAFDPDLVERMAAEIGHGMRSMGVHQGMAPVLDVNRDPRWGRTEETIGEDPYLVATIGLGYVRGLQSAGVIATLKHLAGHAASRAGRNMAPVGIGRRELADVHLPPFLLAVREGGARSVMHSYAEVDGIPPAADPDLLTGLLRTTWGFDGTVVSDYFGVRFLQTLHHVAGEPADAAGLALAAGLDVELPNVDCFGEPLLAAVRDGEIPGELIDRAVTRVLLQKCELGLLDPDWRPVPPALEAVVGTDGHEGRDLRGSLDLDPPHARELARTMAEESVVLLTNDGTLPLREDRPIALVGPQADTISAMLGCYTFPSHVGIQHPGVPLGIHIPTLLEALADELPKTPIEHVVGCDVHSADTSGIPAAVAAATSAEVCVVALGDRAGLFGRGTSGEGCDAEDLYLPGAQEELLTALLDTGVPVVLVLLSGRPYALGRFDGRLAAVVQCFFPGEEGGPAVARVLAGRVNPSGRLPIGMPRHGRGQSVTYLVPPLAQRSEATNVDPTPLYPFGYGLSYTEFDWTDVRIDGRPVDPADRTVTGTDGSVSVSVAVCNTGDRVGAEVVQLYLHDPVAQATRPVVRLIGYAKVRLEPGESRIVSFGVHADLSAFTGRRGTIVVEPGDLDLRLGTSSADDRHVVGIRLVGAEREVDHRRRLTADVSVR
ncbi:MAG TPA: glycoside hydrolase family 3 N-terminal domain-containing protein [Actinophytocola sp.]|uniref:beta-xylosidase/alpha-l-arabinosidase n=1 Tax=Actinophytocola sp. TaxID=1872138 RepID=UPI002DBAE0CC|nr:glycoside hydrolase family 3 N-terminal domain-containing protein [Actinophytocola sp.]HEU5472238.1 glycoside hydrolase family 3 N-terminal domain-containing protein [Actinophytocola sp.]